MYAFRYIPERANKLFNLVAWKLSEIAANSRPNLERLHFRDYGDGERHGEFVYRALGPVYVDPHSGYLITESGVVINESMATNDASDQPVWRISTPSYLHFRRALRDPDCIQTVDSIVSLRYVFEWNYFHFHADVLGKLPLLDEVGISRDLPLLLGPYADELPHVRSVMEMSGLNKRNWLVQGNRYIKANEVVFCRSRHSIGKRLSFIKSVSIPQEITDRQRKIYLSRSQDVVRHVVNENALIPLLEKYEFETIRTEGMTVREQIEVFAGARYLIGIHGAGMTNIMYRQGHPLGVIELYAGNFRTVMHEDMAREFGFEFYKLAGTPSKGIPQHANFKIDLQDLENVIVDMLRI